MPAVHLGEGDPKEAKAPKLFLGVHACLVFPDPRDEKAVLDLMRRFSGATRFAYNRLLEGKPREELKRADGPLFGAPTPQMNRCRLFRLNTRYADGAMDKAKAVLDSALELGNDPKKVVFGGRGLFEQLKRKHLSGKDRERLRQAWKEKRQGLLYTRGDRSKKGGNPHFKLLEEGFRVMALAAVNSLGRPFNPLSGRLYAEGLLAPGEKALLPDLSRYRGREEDYRFPFLVSQSAHFCAPTPHQDGGLGFPATSPTIPKGWA